MPAIPAKLYCGLDLGKVQDFTALAILERPAPQTALEAFRPATYSVRHLERLPLLTPYPEVVTHLRTCFREPAVHGALLAVDGTGCGRPVCDMIRVAGLPARFQPVIITGGAEITTGIDGYLHLPKVELASVLQVLLQERRLQIARSLPEAETLARELSTFSVKTSPTGHETFESWRERDHDDLVFAVGLACWFAERWEAPSSSVVEVVTQPPRPRGPVGYGNDPRYGGTCRDVSSGRRV
jgi:hypothetical protein